MFVNDCWRFFHGDCGFRLLGRLSFQHLYENPFLRPSFSTRQAIVDSMLNGLKKFMIRFHWGFVVGGVLALTLAIVSWTLETSRSYWVWHSIWHMSIYTTSFLFFCSKVTPANTEIERPSGSQTRNFVVQLQCYAVMFCCLRRPKTLSKMQAIEPYDREEACYNEMNEWTYWRP